MPNCAFYLSKSYGSGSVHHFIVIHCSSISRMNLWIMEK